MKSLIYILIFSANIFSQDIDYSNLKNWVAHPQKKDFSDSIPEPFANDKIDGRVDVFYIYPTIYDGNFDFEKMNADINNIEINESIEIRPILYQATCFNIAGPVYSPRYRQAHLSIYNKENKGIKDSVLNFAYQDVKSAFEFYLKNWNNDRPIIIAAHSQGTFHAGRLIKEFFEGRDLYKKLVVAYLPGLFIPPDFFNSVPQCKDSSDVNCFVGWRTIQKDFIPDFAKSEKVKSLVTNPLTWKTENLNYGDFYKHKGAILYDFNKLRPNIIDAQIKDNILWISKPKTWLTWFYFSKDYHIGDINLFYANIRENVSVRIKKYFNEN
ncbi:MAG: DUF3089 domain-containing protein [Bacteroidetes bacterium]|nr:DUF3089 domain-containing protein [Bacteroidota bacterium]